MLVKNKVILYSSLYLVFRSLIKFLFDNSSLQFVDFHKSINFKILFTLNAISIKSPKGNVILV